MDNRDFMQIVKCNFERIVKRNGWGQNILFIATENSSDLKENIKIADLEKHIIFVQIYLKQRNYFITRKNI